MSKRPKGDADQLVGRVMLTINVQKGTKVFNATKRDEDIKRILQGFEKRGYLNRWSAQMEQGEQGLVHWQIYMQAKSNKRMRKSSILRNTQWGGSDLWKWVKEAGHLAVNVADQESFDYCNKEESRMAGHEPMNSEKDGYEKPVPLTDTELYAQHYIGSGNGYGWQKDFLKLTDEWAEDVGRSMEKLMQRKNKKAWQRTLQVIIDEKGNSGKTMMKAHIARKYGHKNVLNIPMMKQGEDLLQFVASHLVGKGGNQTGRIVVKGPWLVTVDVPRGNTGAGCGKKLAGELVAALESIKNGECFDKRYGGRTVVFTTPPIVIVFCNAWPKNLTSANALSQDRVDLKYIYRDKTLHDSPEAPAMNDVNNDALAGGDRVDPMLQYEPGYAGPPSQIPKEPGMHHVHIVSESQLEDEVEESEGGGAGERTRNPFVDDEAVGAGAGAGAYD